MSDLIKWDKRFLELAVHVSTWSKDPSTKVGAVIARGNTEISMGYNGFPKCIIDYDELYLNKEIKYQYIIHAELNAILKAGQEGRDIKGATLYTSPLPPCISCAAIIMGAGITRVVSRFTTPKEDSKYKDFTATAEMFIRGGINYSFNLC